MRTQRRDPAAQLQGYGAEAPLTHEWGLGRAQHIVEMNDPKGDRKYTISFHFSEFT